METVIKRLPDFYLKVAPKVIIEINKKAELFEIRDEYLFLKAEKLLDSSVKR